MALSAMGFTALPLTPPYVVFFSLPTLGQALPLALRPMRPDTVLMAVTPSAPHSQCDQHCRDRQSCKGGRGRWRDSHQYRVRPHGPQCQGQRLAQRRQREEDHVRRRQRQRSEAHRTQGHLLHRQEPARVS